MSFQDVIVIRILPSKPAKFDDFSAALSIISLDIYDLSLKNSKDGELVGRASGVITDESDHLEIVPLAGEDQLRTFERAIVPHFDKLDTGMPGPKVSVATAIVLLNRPEREKEFPTKDAYDVRIRLRSNEGLDVSDPADYNIVGVETIDIGQMMLPRRFEIFNKVPAAYIFLPEFNTLKNQSGSLGKVRTGPDNIPPFRDLVDAINRILEIEDVILQDRQEPLSSAECAHIASELSWNRTANNPPPDPKPETLAVWYTSERPTPEQDQSRQKFEIDLKSYEAVLRAEAIRLANFVFGVSAAIEAEKRTWQTKKAVLKFPVTTNSKDGWGVSAGSVVLVAELDQGSASPFAVPAAYFYALSTSYGTSITVDQRYEAVLLTSEEKLVLDMQAAVDSGVISTNESFLTSPSATPINISQSARRIASLGAVNPSLSVFEISVTSIKDIVEHWLVSMEPMKQFAATFWGGVDGVIAKYPKSYLMILLWFITRGSKDFIEALTQAKPQGLQLASVDDLTATDIVTWKQFFGIAVATNTESSTSTYIGLLPSFLQVGDNRQKVQAWTNYLQRFLSIGSSGSELPTTQVTFQPQFKTPSTDLLVSFIENYNKVSPGSFDFSAPLDPDCTLKAIQAVFPLSHEQNERASLRTMIDTLYHLFQLTLVSNGKEIQFSLMEALYSRGIVSIEAVSKLSVYETRNALRGTVAFKFASDINSRAKNLFAAPTQSGQTAESESFRPINADGKLINVIPPMHLSPYGPIQYVHELFELKVGSEDLSSLLDKRRGFVSFLNTSIYNANIQLPKLDIVNENLEALASHVSTPTGQIYNTSASSTANPSSLLALPEHSTPALNIKAMLAYEKIRKSFESPDLPYSQYLDVNRSYLEQIGTTRLQTIRTFHHDTTDFPMRVVNKQNHPANFEGHRWRLPCSFAAALEFIGISFEEYETLYSGELVTASELRTMLGFPSYQQEPGNKGDNGVAGNGGNTNQPGSINKEPNDGAPLCVPSDTQAPEWDPSGRIYQIGDLVRYRGQLFEARQTHTSEVQWFPSGPLAALWHIPTPCGTTEWKQNTHYRIGSRVTYLQKTYRCLSEHTADASDWTPLLAPALWSTLEEKTKNSDDHASEDKISNLNTAPSTTERSGVADPNSWQQEVSQMSEFLRRTGLTYRQFTDFVHSGSTEISSDLPGGKFPESESNDIAFIRINFHGEIVSTLRKCLIVIRLWRSLQCSLGISFASLAQLCSTLQIFSDTEGKVNPDFIRQLSSLLMIRDYMHIPLEHLLPLYAQEISNDRLHTQFCLIIQSMENWLVGYNGIKLRETGFKESLLQNMKPLSDLAGFCETPGVADHWHDCPTNTIRFLEVVAHVYESKFTSSELIFLFTSQTEQVVDTPFAFQDMDDAAENPLNFPDASDYDLWTLRRSLLDIAVSEDDAEALTWKEMLSLLRQTGFTKMDQIQIMAEHFFPSILISKDQAVEREKCMFYATLKGTDAGMWTYPFEYSGNRLSFQLPLKDEDILNMLRESRMLSPDEQNAIQNLYFAPRAMLAPLSMFFEDFNAAVDFLIHCDSDENRWKYFRLQFLKCYRRVEAIATHIARHVVKITDGKDAVPDDLQLARAILLHLSADENYPRDSSKTWESSSLNAELTWESDFAGGAFAALLGLIGTGLKQQFHTGSDSKRRLLWQDVSSGVKGFGNEARNTWNVPVPTRLPQFEPTSEVLSSRYVIPRNGLAVRDKDDVLLGGGAGFEVSWTGALLIEETGRYEFDAIAPSISGEVCHKYCQSYWTVKLARRDKEFYVLHHTREARNGIPTQMSRSIQLLRGAYEIEVQFWQLDPVVSQAHLTDSLLPISTGFELKYRKFGQSDVFQEIPQSLLFASSKETSLAEGIAIAADSNAHHFLQSRYYSTLRDIRRTYQRAFKAVLLSRRFGLSATLERQCNNTSEIQYLLQNPLTFAGKSYYCENERAGYDSHAAPFNFNIIPVTDTFNSPKAEMDQRAYPSAQRKAALFDWFERLFQFTSLRRLVETSTRRKPMWFLFYEAKTQNATSAAQLLLHLGIDVSAASAVLTFLTTSNSGVEQPNFLNSAALVDERWAYRIWRAGQWIENVQRANYIPKIELAQPALWASSAGTNTSPSHLTLGNYSLMKFVLDCFTSPVSSTAVPHGLQDITSLNNGLRSRARTALVSYLCSGNKVSLSAVEDNRFARKAVDLSSLLLIDVECQVDETTTRLTDATQAAQTLVERASLGLERCIALTPSFLRRWKNRYQSFELWQSSKSRLEHPENWFHFEEIRQSRRSEGFDTLEKLLDRGTHSLVSPTATNWWHSKSQVPKTGNLVSFQHSSMTGLSSLVAGEDIGLQLAANSQLSARPSMVTPMFEHQSGDSNDSGTTQVPLWIRSAVRMRTKFIRVAAAGPPHSSEFPFAWTLDESDDESALENSDSTSHMVDEYWFWLSENASFRDEQPIRDADIQSKNPLDPNSAWDSKEKISNLLQWKKDACVYLQWTRLRNGRYDPPGCSDGAVQIDPEQDSQLEFIRRSGDSLYFIVTSGSRQETSGFIYNLPDGYANPASEIQHVPVETSFPGSLAAYPYFLYHRPGAPILPTSRFSTDVLVALKLKAEGSLDDALKWCSFEHNPLQMDNKWTRDGSGTNQKKDVNKRKAKLLLYLETLLEKVEMQLNQGPQGYRQARTTLNCIEHIMGDPPQTQNREDDDTENSSQVTIKDFKASDSPLNPRLLAIYADVEAKRSQIRHLAAESHSTQGSNLSSLLSNECHAPLTYRFKYLLPKAIETVAMVRDLGRDFLQALEQGDSEYLASLQAMHEKQVQALTLDVRQNEWRESDWQLQALEKSMSSAQTRLRYNLDLVARGLNSNERSYEGTTGTAVAFMGAAAALEGVAQVIAPTPDLAFGGAGVGGSPLQWSTLPVGTKLAHVFRIGANVSNTLGQQFSTLGELLLTKSDWERRDGEWRQEIDVTGVDIEQIKRDLLAAKRRRAISLRQLNIHQRQMENTNQVQAFLRDRFSKQDLYLFLQGEVASTYRQAYDLAVKYATDVLKSYLFEMGHFASSPRNINSTIQNLCANIRGQTWKSLPEGLRAGERLDLALRFLERDYLGSNTRELELKKTISLREHFPAEFLILKSTGRCVITVPEWLFDLDYPGQYMRRIKTIKVTLSVTTESYAQPDVHCRLRLLASSVRLSADLPPDAMDMCVVGNDPAVVRSHYYIVKPESQVKTIIVTSSGTDDAGMFESDTRDDERYFPFEYCGAMDSRWLIEVPHDNNDFDVRDIDQFRIEIGYSAREGHEILRSATKRRALLQLANSTMTYVDARQDLSNEWSLCFDKSSSDAIQTKDIENQLGYGQCARIWRNLALDISPHYYSGSHVRSIDLDPNKWGRHFKIRLPKSLLPTTVARKFLNKSERLILNTIDIFIEIDPLHRAHGEPQRSRFLELAFLPPKCCTPHQTFPSVVRQELGDSIYHGTISTPVCQNGKEALGAHGAHHILQLGDRDFLDLGEICFPRNVMASDSKDEREEYLRKRKTNDPFPTVVRNIIMLVAYKLQGENSEDGVREEVNARRTASLKADFL